MDNIIKVDVLHILTKTLHMDGPISEENLQQRKQLKTANDILNCVLECSLDSIIVIDKHSIIRVWNSACEKLFGFSKEETIGLSTDIIMNRNHQIKHHNAIERYKETGEKYMIGTTRITPATTKDKKEIMIEITVTETPDKKFFIAIIRGEDQNTKLHIDDSRNF